MRNSPFRSQILKSTALLCLGALLFGCQADKKSREELRSGYSALETQQFDAAIARADAYLAKQPNGPGSAEALYLRGRALEQKVATNSDARTNLAAARSAYSQALQQQPPQRLVPLIYVGIGNTSYWQGDYATAQQNLVAAYDKLDAEDAKAFVLYRIGLCQQRLGQFDAADKTFAQVQQKYPNFEAADRAKAHAGFKSFAVQLATFANPQGADVAVNKLRQQGVNPNRVIDPRGRHVITVGPLNSYPAAESLKERFAGTYPDAVIVP